MTALPSSSDISNSLDIVLDSRKRLLAHYRKENAGKPPEKMFAEAIRMGMLKIVRRRGKPPAIIWL